MIWEAFRSGTAPEGGDTGSAQGGGGFVPSFDGIGGTSMQPDLAGASYSGGGFVPSGPMTPPVPQGQSAFDQPYTVQPSGQTRPPMRSTSTVPDADEPLIRFDPVTGEMIVSQDPAISVVPAPGIVYREPDDTRSYQAVPQQAPAQGWFPQAPVANAEDVGDGRGLY